MATPNVGILTNSGKNLIDQVNAGKTKITFSKIVFSSMNNNQLTDDQIKALTTIAPQEIVVNNPKVTLDNNTGETRIRATGNNEALTDGVYVKTYAVYAKDDSGDEILYGITVSPNPNYLPEYDGVTPQAVTYSYKVNISNTSNITFTNSNDIYVSDTDLAEALQPYAKTVDVNQQLDKKVVDNKDGTEQLNGVKTHPFNKLSDTIGGRNLLTGTSETLQTVTNAYGYNSNLPSIAPVVTKIDSDATYTVRAWLSPASYDMSVQVVWQDSSGTTHYPGGNTIYAGTSGYSAWTGTITAGSTIQYVTIIFTVYKSTASTISYKEMKLEKGSVATDWCPAPEDKVNVADMRKPANAVLGLDDIKSSTLPNGTDLYTLINTSGKPLSYHVTTYTAGQSMVNKPTTKLSAFKLNTASVGDSTSSNYNYTFLTLRDDSDGSIYEALLASNASGAITAARPWYKVADDSKVSHLSGANNFDTVPTVNNNPLLLASSLPSDLARTGSNQEFTGKNTFDTAPIDKTTGNPYITKDGVPAVPSTLADTTKPANFTAGLQSGGVDVATAADLKSLEDASWHTITGKSDSLSAYTCMYRKNNEQKYVDLVLYGIMGIFMNPSDPSEELLDLSEIISARTLEDVEGNIAYPAPPGSGYAGVTGDMFISGTKILFNWKKNATLLSPGNQIISFGNDLNSPFLRVTFD